MSKNRITALTIVSYVALILFALMVIVPFILLIVISFTDESAIIQNGYQLIPESLSLDGYTYVFSDLRSIISAYLTTIGVTVVGVAVSLVLVSMMAYPLSRRDLPGRKILLFFVIFTMLFSGGIVPQYLIYTKLFHMKDTYAGLIVPNLLLSAFNVVLVKSYFEFSIPHELVEAAVIDGAREFQIFRIIVLPLSKPILATISLNTALYYWNDYTNGLYYISDSKFYTLQMLLNRMLSNVAFLRNNSDVLSTMGTVINLPAASIKYVISVIAIIPLLIAFPFFEKHFVKGITLGSVKG